MQPDHTPLIPVPCAWGISVGGSVGSLDAQYLTFKLFGFLTFNFFGLL